MGRAKLKLELIPNSRSRRVTFEKRKKGLMKKAEEFKTLCGVDTCMIIYPVGTSSDGLVKPEIWPAESKEVERIVCRYQSEATHRRAKHVTGLREFFASRNKKIEAELAEARRANWEAKYPVLEEPFKDLSEPQLRSSLNTVSERLKQMKKRLATMKEKRRAETVAQSDCIAPSVGGDVLASNASLVQEGGWVEEGGGDVLASNASLVQEGGWVEKILFEENTSVGLTPECQFPLSYSSSEYWTQQFFSSELLL